MGGFASFPAEDLPRRGVAYTLVMPIVDVTDGSLVTGAADLDTEVSKDLGAFADATDELAEIGSSGLYEITVTAGEMLADIVTVKTTTSTVNAMIVPVVLRPI